MKFGFTAFKKSAKKSLLLFQIKTTNPKAVNTMKKLLLTILHNFLQLHG